MESKLLGVTFAAISILKVPSSLPHSYSAHHHHTSLKFQSKSGANEHHPFLASSSFRTRYAETRVDSSQTWTLDGIRKFLILQESIIFNLLLRAQYGYNADSYNHDPLCMGGFHGSLVEFIVKETERLHAQVGRYRCPDEHPFFPETLPDPMLPPLQYPMALSRRIHYGKFVAEAKFQESPVDYEAAIKVQDRARLMRLLTYEAVEAAVKKRVEVKTRKYGQEVRVNQEDEAADPIYKMEPNLVANLYEDWIMPLTKEVQVEYLLRRLD